MRVVLVDDVAEIRQLISEVLTKAGHEIVGQAADGSSAVQETLAERPELVITDFRMPQTDGVEATRRIRAGMPERRCGRVVLDDRSHAP